MAWGDLGLFLALLEKRGDLRRITVEVDTVLELAEITSRVSKLPDGGSGIYFEKVTGSRFPVVANIFGSARRMALALGVESLDGLLPLMSGILKKLDRSPAPPPMIVPEPSCREVVEAVPDLASRCPITCSLTAVFASILPSW